MGGTNLSSNERERERGRRRGKASYFNMKVKRRILNITLNIHSHQILLIEEYFIDQFSDCSSNIHNNTFNELILLFSSSPSPPAISPLIFLSLHFYMKIVSIRNETFMPPFAMLSLSSTFSTSVPFC